MDFLTKKKLIKKKINLRFRDVYIFYYFYFFYKKWGEKKKKYHIYLITRGN